MVIRFLKAKSALINKDELESLDKMGIDNIEPAQVKVLAYYPIDQCNIHAITEFVNNEGLIVKGRSNIIFIGESTIVTHLDPEDFIRTIKGEIISL